MKLSRTLVFLMACTLSLAASAQWQWVDKTGRKVYSDRPPPSDIPEKSILKQPSGARNASVAAPAAPAATSATVAALPASAASGSRPAASGPLLSGKDSELETKKKQAELDAAARKKVADDKVAADRASNCERAKGNLRTLQSGQRVKQTNAQGEQEVMSDDSRAAESKRMQDVIGTDCAK